MAEIRLYEKTSYASVHYDEYFAHSKDYCGPEKAIKRSKQLFVQVRYTALRK